MNKTAIIVISHNSKDITEGLCNSITKNTRCPNDILVVETGSKKEEITKYPTLHTPDGIRMTNGINLGIHYMKMRERIFNIYYDTFWILMNDTILKDEDTLGIMLDILCKNELVGEVHPHIENSPSSFLRKKDVGNSRVESFCEFVCPLFTRKAIDLDLFDSRFFYGWGLDFTIPYILHNNNLRIHVSNQVGCVHNAGTTVRSGKDEDFKNMVEQFDASRENMIDTLEQKLGKFWARMIYKSIPEGVSKDAFLDWGINIGRNFTMEDIK